MEINSNSVGVASQAQTQKVAPVQASQSADASAAASSTPVAAGEPVKISAEAMALLKAEQQDLATTAEDSPNGQPVDTDPPAAQADGDPPGWPPTEPQDPI